MSLELVMNADGELDHASGSPISGGTFAIAGTLYLSVKAEGKGVFIEPFTYTFSGGDATGFDSGSIATTSPQTIPATAVKVKANGGLVMRVGDLAEMEATGTVGGTPTVITGDVEVADAGQSTVRAQ